MHLYGLILGIAIVIGINYFSKHHQTIPQKFLNPFLAGLLISAIIGARLYHVIDYWSYYSQNTNQIFQTWNGGLGIFGGLLGGLVFVFIFATFLKIKFLSILDSIAPILPLCQAIGRLGNFVNQENPIWWPEAILDLLLFFIIKRFPQHPTAKYFVGYGLIRFSTEFFRPETWMYHSIKIGQVVSIIFIVIGITIWTASKKP